MSGEHQARVKSPNYSELDIGVVKLVLVCSVGINMKNLMTTISPIFFQNFMYILTQKFRV